MNTLLHIKASPRDERSYSNGVAEALIEEYGKSHPEDRVVTLDLFTMDLPPFDGLTLQAKYRILYGEEHTEEERQAWSSVEKIIEQFKSADKYILSVPMWNFGIPYRLKHYLDLLLQPGYTFAYDPEKGYQGLVTGKPAIVIYSRGGEYSEESGKIDLDFQKKYMDLALGFIGITDTQSIVIEPALAGGPATAAQKKKSAMEAARELARRFDIS